MAHRFFTLGILLLTLVALGLGCRCDPPPPFEKAVKEAKNSNSRYYIAKVLSERRPSNQNADITYKLSVTTGCDKKRTQTVTTCGNSVCCGVKLKVGAYYAVPLLMNGWKCELNSCQVFREVKKQSKKELKLLEACPCYSKKCNPTKVCVKGRCVPRKCEGCKRPECKKCDKGWWCYKNRCRPLKSCKNKRCSPANVCVGGICVPRNCSRCKAAFCKPCDEGWHCYRSRCKRRTCATVRCKKGWVCERGKCLPYCRPRCNCGYCICHLLRRRCPKGMSCVKNICRRNSCKCGPKKVCVGDKCVERNCSRCKAGNCKPCDKGWHCVQSRCKKKSGEPMSDSSCATVRCTADKVCVGGKCLPRDCSNCKEPSCMSCEKGWRCVKSRCVIK